MSLPKSILNKIDEALNSVKYDIKTRQQRQDSFKDLEKIEKELQEMKAESRQTCSQEMSRMIIDSMNWDQPCLKKFDEVLELLRKHYKLR